MEWIWNKQSKHKNQTKLPMFHNNNIYIECKIKVWSECLSCIENKTAEMRSEKSPSG